MNSSARPKKRENAGAVLSVCFGLIVACFGIYSIYYWSYLAAVNEDPVTVEGRILDIGSKGGGMSYEYIYQGKTYEGEDARRNAFGKWTGGPIDVTLSARAPEKSTVSVDSLRDRAISHAQVAVVAFVLCLIAGFFGIRHKRSMPINAPPDGPSSISGRHAILFLAGIAFIATAAGLAVSIASGERQWLLNGMATLQQPNVSADVKVELLRKSFEVRKKHNDQMMPVLLWVGAASLVILVGIAALSNRRR